MKPEAMGTILVRFSAAVFALRSFVGLVMLVWYYAKMHGAVAANPSLQQGFQQSLKAGTWMVAVTLASAVVCWLASRPVGRLLASGLEEVRPAAPDVPATG